MIGTVAVGMLLSAAPTSAMTDLAEFDGDAHPEVVALLYRTPDGSRAYQYCTGTLISPTVVLTASHCNDGLLETGWDLIVTNDPILPPVDATGWFDADLKNVAAVAQVVSNPLYERGYRDDVSAQVLAKSLGVSKRRFPALPEPGRPEPDGSGRDAEVHTDHGAGLRHDPADRGPGIGVRVLRQRRAPLGGPVHHEPETRSGSIRR